MLDTNAVVYRRSSHRRSSLDRDLQRVRDRLTCCRFERCIEFEHTERDTARAGSNGTQHDTVASGDTRRRFELCLQTARIARFHRQGGSRNGIPAKRPFPKEDPVATEAVEAEFRNRYIDRDLRTDR